MKYPKIKEFTIAHSGPIPKVVQALSKDEIKHLENMVNDEFKELHEAKTLSEQVDAFADILYYVLDAAYRKGIDLMFYLKRVSNIQSISKRPRISRIKTIDIEAYVATENLKTFGLLNQKGVNEEAPKQIEILALFVVDTLNTCWDYTGIHIVPILNIVHEANMQKVKSEVIKSKSGKVEKPKGWVDPDELIKKEIERQKKEVKNGRRSFKKKEN